ncbi:MAG: DUF488 domain-containing protein [Firmicutes bacterium]|nr:DUF488 domain-containing protein [Bacillota bacterium]
MHTGYFAKVKSYPQDLRFVSIARFNRFWKGETYPALSPTPDMLKIEDEKQYRDLYYARVLNKLEPEKVYADLKDAVLLCYEKDKFCHRHLVARWLEEHIISLIVTELE